jgi:hypothetical protein
MTCYSALARDVNPYQFCDNSPYLKYDAFGLALTEQDCEDAKEAILKAAKQNYLQCLKHTTGHAIIGGLCWGIGGVVVGGVGGMCVAGGDGLVGGMLLGGAGGEAVDVCITGHNLSNCNKEYAKAKEAAQQVYDNCMKKVNQ